jgi:phosphoribosylformylglycinamidine cyclo-ligase
MNTSYKKAGVDINTTDAIKKNLEYTVNSCNVRVLNRMGAFASLLEGRFPNLRHPVLVYKTEEPGSKQKIAHELGRTPDIAYDLVNHLINDIIVMGAEPLYVQDCIVCGTIDAGLVSSFVQNMSKACREQGCVLVGGETSVQPGVIADGTYIFSASAIGVVEKDSIIDGSKITEACVVLGVASNGLHTNGYSLVRKIIEYNPELKVRDVSGDTFIKTIMRPHLCYFNAVKGLFDHKGLMGLAHITGGGIQDNLNRILPSGLDALIDLSSIRIHPIFKVVKEEGNIAEADMLRTFNMGIGLTIVCAPDSVQEMTLHLEAHGHSAYPIGTITKGNKKVRFSGGLTW